MVATTTETTLKKGPNSKYNMPVSCTKIPKSLVLRGATLLYMGLLGR